MWEELRTLLLWYLGCVLLLVLISCTIHAEETVNSKNSFQTLEKLYEKQDALMTSLKSALNEQSEVQKQLKTDLEQALIELDSLKLELTISQELSEQSKLQITKLEQKLNELEQSVNELIKENKSLKVQRIILAILLGVALVL